MGVLSYLHGERGRGGGEAPGGGRGGGLEAVPLALEGLEGWDGSQTAYLEGTHRKKCRGLSDLVFGNLTFFGKGDCFSENVAL